MRMLIRDNAIARRSDGTRILAGSPDSGERSQRWCWTVTTAEAVDGSRRVHLDVDGDQVTATMTDHDSGSEVDLDRRAGTHLLVTTVTGRAEIADLAGPWRRTLAMGDVVIFEGDEVERLHLTLSPTGSRVTVVGLAAVGDRSLRWVP